MPVVEEENSITMMTLDRSALRESNPFRRASFIRKQLLRLKRHYESGRVTEYRERLMIRRTTAGGFCSQISFKSTREQWVHNKINYEIYGIGRSVQRAAAISDDAAFVVLTCTVLIDNLRMLFSESGTFSIFYQVVEAIQITIARSIMLLLSFGFR